MTAPHVAPEIRALVLAALGKRIAAEETGVKAEFSPRYELGTTIKWESPLDGALLGYVQRTRPKPEFRITDEDALREHLAAEFPGTVETVWQLPVPGVGLVTLDPLDELAVVLREHAPHMLVEQQRVTDEAVTAALDESKASGVAAAPGITLVRPGGSLRVVPDKAAGEAVDRMAAAGLLRWDGGRLIIDAPTPAAELEAS